MAAQFPRAQGGDFDLPLTTPHGATGRVGNFSPEGNHSSKCDLPSYLARRLSNQEKRRPIKSLQPPPPACPPSAPNCLASWPSTTLPDWQPHICRVSVTPPLSGEALRKEPGFFASL